jgi:zinc protease
MYGQDHPYGIPFTGSGTTTAIAKLERSDLESFYRQWLRPDNATIFVVGDTSLEEIAPLLEEYFGDWQAPRRPLSGKDLAEMPLSQASRFFLVDRPGSPQSLILAGHLAPPTGNDNNLEIVIMNDILGGSYNARANQNIRVDKGWAYGAYTFLQDAQGQRPWMVYAPVQSDKTAEAIAEFFDMIEAYRSDDPATPEELQRSIDANTNSLPGQYETADAVMGALLDNQRFGRPDDYVNTLKPRIDAISLDAVRTSASTYLHPDRLTWVIVGDLEMIEPGIEALVTERGLGEIRTLEIDGG